MAGGITAEGIIFRLRVSLFGYVLDLNSPLLIVIVIITAISLVAV